ncbi:MAG: hypothetical protein Q8N17_26220 [Burkholderiaceae bacterium]|nr:hypothetical protein [Burkholderiaceae bacterium]
MTDLLTPICEGCANPARGLFVAGCRDCALRDLAAGPLFFGSMREGKLTPAYREALRALGEPAAVHMEVRKFAKKHVTGAQP